MQASRLRLLSYNIHQGITVSRNRLTLAVLRAAIRSLDADVVVLQEVAGSTIDLEAGSSPGRLTSQLEELADEVWPHHAYGTNAVFTTHSHGNAVLSRFPILSWRNENITVGRLEPRGILHVTMLALGEQPVHVMGIHLGLSQGERKEQARRLRAYVENNVPGGAPLFVAGDFNDWRRQISRELVEGLLMREAFRVTHRHYARTFPSRLPFFHLDRIYFRGCELESASCLRGKPWNTLSDHLPLLASFRAQGAPGSGRDDQS